MRMKRIAIIGAGIGGMTAAYDLAKNGNEVTLFEASDHLGGLASGFKKPNWKWSLEIYYHHWFQTDRDILGLIDELGLINNVCFYQPKTVVYHNGNFNPLDSPLSALFFPGFSLVDIARFGFVTLYLRYLSRWQPLEKFTAHEWLRKYYGKKLFELLYEPLLIGKFGQYHQQVNMAWFWARFKTRTTKLGTFEGGLQAFVDQFTEILKTRGVRIRLNSPVNFIQPMPDGSLKVKLSNEEAEFDQVLVTTSPQIFTRMAPSLTPEYVNQLNSLKSIGALALILSLKHPLSTKGYYWFNLPKSAGFPFLALVEHTNFVSSENFSGEHILYCGDYLDPAHEYFSLSKAELLNRFIPSLKQINPDFDPSWITESWLSRSTYAQPIPFVNHSANIPGISTPIPDLFFASMSQIYPWDRGTNYAVQLARQAVQLMSAKIN
jgi:protoporphyrinogen oxidase